MIGEPLMPDGGHDINSLERLGIEIPPLCQVAVAVVSDGFVSSRYPVNCGVRNSVPK